MVKASDRDAVGRTGAASLAPQLAQLRIRHLTLLDHIAAQGSLRGVADRLHVTQPAVTAMVQELEAVFGAGLVRRDRQGASLTAKGEAARGRLQRVLNELQATRFASAATPSGRLLRIGMLPVAMIGFAPRLIAALSDGEPGITLQLREQTVDPILADVYSGTLDCAISRCDANSLASYPRDAFLLRPILRMDIQVASGPSHRLLKRRTVPLAELAAERWALPSSESQIRLAFVQAFVQNGMTAPLPTVESLSFAANFHLASKSSLLTIAPGLAVTEFAARGIVRRLNVRWPVRLSPLMLIVRRENAKAPEIVALAAALEVAAREEA